MYKHILLPTDGSKLSAKCAKEAIKLASALGARITAIHVADKYHLDWQSEDWKMPVIPELKARFDEAVATRASGILRKVQEAGLKAGVRCIL